MTSGSGFGEAAPQDSAVILVSAPGAVGKTTLARQIASETGAMFVDLATADPVGANTLVGGLARTNLYQAFLRGDSSLIVDGLDEARMRVNQDSFAAFMNDVVVLSDPQRKPIVLLGRTGAVQESWLWLSESGIEAPVLEIGYYGQTEASKFARIQAKTIRKEQHDREPDGRAIDLILERIRTQAGEDADSFVGYSPVLIAVAKWVADPDSTGIQNTQRLISEVERGKGTIALSDISQSILVREQKKIQLLAFQDRSLKDRLYLPKEQLELLSSVIYETERPLLPDMPPGDRQTYGDAIETWLLDHPFLDGDRRGASSAVFGGAIASAALRFESTAEVALSKELSLGTATNPFIADFHIGKADNPESRSVPASHIGLLYASVRSRLSLYQTANLRVDADDGDDPGLEAEVEISLGDSSGQESHTLRFSSEAYGDFRFGPHTENVDITAPHARFSITSGPDAVLVSPIRIEVDGISLGTNRLVVEAAPSAIDVEEGLSSIVFLKANRFSAPGVNYRPTLRGRVELQLVLPGPVFPWREFTTEDEHPDEDPRMHDALYCLKKILRLFRCHGRGQLAKFGSAIDDPRRSRGMGRCARDQLLRERILNEVGAMYVLDPDLLAERAGLTFQDVRGSGFTPRTLKFLRRAIENC